MTSLKFRIFDEETKTMHYDIKAYAKSINETAFDVLTAGFKGIRVMQWTGLVDRQGKQIWEGDVVKVRGLKEPQIVGFDAGWASYCFVYDTGEMMRSITPREIIKMEVLGDIHQHPHLLSQPITL